MTVHEFVDAVIRYCALTTGSVTSWGRSINHNQEVGGVEYSAHLVWLAVDVVYWVRPNHLRAEELVSRLGLRLIREPDHDHLQPLDWRKG